MPPVLRTLFFSLIVLAFCAIEPAAAQSEVDNFPDVQLNSTGTSNVHQLDRGPGWYLSLPKIVACWLLLVLWVKTTDWVSRDCVILQRDYGLWNSVVLFPFLLAFILAWVIPIFAVGYTLLILCYVGPLAAYIYFRNQAVEPYQQVLTPDHLRFLLAGVLQRVGIKIDAEKKFGYQKGAPVELAAQGGADDQVDQANLIAARQSPGFLPLKELLADAIERRSDAIMLDYTSESVGVRYQIDGHWHTLEARDRESGDLMLAVMKTLSALDAGQRRKRQDGAFRAGLNGSKVVCKLTSQGTKTGERAMLVLDRGAPPMTSLVELGMREKMRDQLLEIINRDSGLVLFSSLPQGGLTTTFDVALLETDRLTRDFAAIENVHAPENEIENVSVTTFDAAAGETPATVLPKLLRKYPNVLIARDLADAESVIMLCEQVKEKRLVVGSVRAREAAEALLRILALKVPGKTLAGAATAVVNQRLIRKLCTGCRVAYEPTPEMLKKLGLPAGRVEALYREPKPEEIEKPCPECQGIGYLGRTSIFELLVVDERVRKALTAEPSLDRLRAAAKPGGWRSLQEEGILLAAKGVTSLSELQRVLKNG